MANICWWLVWKGLTENPFCCSRESKWHRQFYFWDYPPLMPETEVPDTNVYDMRLVKHEDGWIYGLFCTERRDPNAADSDQSAAIAQCGIARTKDLVEWDRLPDLKNTIGTATQRGVASGICKWQVRFLHKAAG